MFFFSLLFFVSYSKKHQVNVSESVLYIPESNAKQLPQAKSLRAKSRGGFLAGSPISITTAAAVFILFQLGSNSFSFSPMSFW